MHLSACFAWTHLLPFVFSVLFCNTLYHCPSCCLSYHKSQIAKYKKIVHVCACLSTCFSINCFLGQCYQMCVGMIFFNVKKGFNIKEGDGKLICIHVYTQVKKINALLMLRMIF